MGPTFFLSLFSQDEREARETVKREQDEAYRLSLEADRKKVVKLYKLSWIHLNYINRNNMIWPISFTIK